MPIAATTAATETVGSSSAGRRSIQVVSLCIALAVAATVTVRPGRGLEWAFRPAGPPPAVDAKVDAGLDHHAAVSVIVQARPGAEDAAASAVQAAGGRVGTPLPLVNGFEATATGAALRRAAGSPAVQAITGNRSGRFTQRAAGDDAPASSFPASTDATTAWSRQATGAGVGVAVIDTGVSPVPDLAGRVVHGPDLSGEGNPIDTYGHGTVMAGLIAGDGTASTVDGKARYGGMAPDAHVVAVKAAGADGATDVVTVLRAMQWVSAHREQLGIRVLNLSWGTASTQDPALDPLNYAVERLWSEGIVVVVAAGNGGPAAATITKPADDPMVITVGAYDERGDVNPNNDTVTRWSAQGPTAAGLAKPDLVAPGRTLVSTRSPGSTVERENPDALVGNGYIKGSGTSQAAAVTSGAAALVLAAHPTYTPDQVKAVLTGSAMPLPSAGRNEAGWGRLQVGAALAAAPGPASWQAAPALADASLAGDPAAWTGVSWTGVSWTGVSWTGVSWTGVSWTGVSWTGVSWTGVSWTGVSWTAAFWGDHPRASQPLPGEVSAS